jgi:hypothetical protein
METIIRGNYKINGYQLIDGVLLTDKEAETEKSLAKVWDNIDKENIKKAWDNIPDNTKK